MTSGMIAWSCAVCLVGVATGLGLAEDLDIANAFAFFVGVALLVSFGAWMW